MNIISDLPRPSARLQQNIVEARLTAPERYATLKKLGKRIPLDLIHFEAAMSEGALTQFHQRAILKLSNVGVVRQR